MPLTSVDVLRRVAQDSGPFVYLANRFRPSATLMLQAGVDWIGPVIASPVAVYFIKALKEGDRSRVRGAGAALNRLSSGGLDKVSTCQVADLPAAVKEACDKSADKTRMDVNDEVIIIPLVTVSEVKTGIGSISFVSGGDEVVAVVAPLSVAEKKLALEEMGWSLNRLLVPQAEAIHDTRLPEERAKTAARNKRKNLVVIVVILLLLGLIAVLGTIMMRD